MSKPLEPGPQEREAVTQAAVASALRYLDDNAHIPAYDPRIPDDLMQRVAEPLSEEPSDLGTLIDVVDRMARTGMNTAGPGHLGFIPNGALYTGALGSFLSKVTNRYVGIPMPSPPAVRMEANVVGWIAQALGLPETAGGILTSGGSLANLSAVLAARARLGEDFGDGVVYVNEHVHHSVLKSVRIAGFPRGSVVAVTSDANVRMDVDALEACIEQDRADGRRPCMVVATAGTTNTGAIDPLARVADVCRRHDVWFHVDAAYGGFFALTERGAARLQGMAEADSITVDPHKGLFLPYGVGALVVREPESLVRAHAEEAAYMQNVAAGGDLPNYSDLGPELSRPFRGLEVWLPLRLHGVAAFRRELDRMLDLAEHAAARLRAIDGITVPWEPEFSIVPFHAGDDDASRRILEALNGSGRVITSPTTVDGRLILRFAFLSQRTDRQRVEEALDVIAQREWS